MVVTGQRFRSRLRTVAIDITPLRRSREFRRLWLGQVVSIIGTQVTTVAVQIQMYVLTHSSLDVGLIGLAGLIPMIVFGLYGGAIADAMDRRKLVIFTTSASACVSGVLAWQAFAAVNASWLLYVCVAMQAGLFSVDMPGRRAFIPRLLPSEEIPAAQNLGMVVMNLGVLIGPALAGGLVSGLGYGWAYAFDAVSYGAALYAVWRLPAMHPTGGGVQAGVASVVDGLRFLSRHPVLMMTFLVDIDAMVLGNPRAVIPAIAFGHFHGGAGTAGLMYSACGIGSLLIGLTGGWFGRVNRQGVAIVVSIVVWGVAITLFGIAPWLWLAMVLLGVAFAADMVSSVYRSTMLLVATPDEMMGRLGGVFTVVVAGGPRLGDLEAGTVASLSTPTVSVVSGGIACVVGVLLLAAAVPRFMRYDARQPEA